MHQRLSIFIFVVLACVSGLHAQNLPPPSTGGFVDIEATAGSEVRSQQHDYLPAKPYVILAERIVQSVWPLYVQEFSDAIPGAQTATFSLDLTYGANHPEIIRPIRGVGFPYFGSESRYLHITLQTVWDNTGKPSFDLAAVSEDGLKSFVIRGAGEGRIFGSGNGPGSVPRPMFHADDVSDTEGKVGWFTLTLGSEYRHLPGIQYYWTETQPDGSSVVYHTNYYDLVAPGLGQFKPLGVVTTAGTPGHGPQATLVKQPFEASEAYQKLKTAGWTFTDTYQPVAEAEAHYAFGSDAASASKLRYKLQIQPGLARTITWMETFTPEGASEPSDRRFFSETVTAEAEETLARTIDPFERLGNQPGRYRVVAFESDAFDASLTADTNGDGALLPASGPMTEHVIANADAVSITQPYKLQANLDDDDNDGTPDAFDDHVNGVDDLAEFFPVFLNIKSLLTALPSGVVCKLSQADGALSFIYTDLKYSEAFDFRDDDRDYGYGPDLLQPVAEATVLPITKEGVALSPYFLSRIRNNNQGVILIESRYSSSAPLVLTIETGTGVAIVSLPLQAIGFGLFVDANRDGEIKTDGSDMTTSDRPYRFWINDDDDNSFQEARWSDSDPEHYPARRADASNHIIDGPRDCEDLSRIWIDANGLLDILKSPANNLYLGFKWRSTYGTHPSIRLFRSADATGGLGHIKNAPTALVQGSSTYGNIGAFKACLADADAQPQIDGENLWQGITTAELPTDIENIRVADFIFRKDALMDIFGSRATGYLLFEGVLEGRGELTVVIVRKKSDGTWEKAMDGGSVWLQLDNIRRMYVRAHATPNDADFPLPWQVSSPPVWPYEEGNAAEGKPLAIPQARLSYAVGDSVELPTTHPYAPSPGEQAKCVVFVHGIDLNVPAQQGYAQSFFKRLWWEGYRGRFVVFRWSTTLADGIADTPYGWGQEGNSIYNSGEYRAFKGGTSLRKFVEGLRTPGDPFYFGVTATFGLAAHSQGNIVAGEALRQGMLVNNYVALEAAVPVSCYYPTGSNPPTVPRLDQAELLYPTKFTNSYYQGYFQNLGDVQKTSYFNASDFWLITGQTSFGVETNWIRNNEAFKPSNSPGTSRYVFDFLTGPAFEPGTGIRGITDPHETMSFVARALTLPLGATSDPPGFSNRINLNVEYEFSEQRRDHSGQFQREIQLMYGNASGTPWRADDGSELPLYLRLMRDLGVQP